MAFKKQRNYKEAITLFGNQKLLEALKGTKIFEEANINLGSKDCITVDEAIIALRNDSNISYLLIFAEAFVGIKNGLEHAMEDLRREFHSLKIAIFFTKEKPAEELQDKAFSLKIFNLYYAEDGNFDFAKVIEDLQYGKATQLIKEEPLDEIEEPAIIEPVETPAPTVKEELEKPIEQPEEDENEKELLELKKKIAMLEFENANLKTENKEVLKLKTEIQNNKNKNDEHFKQMSELLEKQEDVISRVKKQAQEDTEAIKKEYEEKSRSLDQKLEEAKLMQDSQKPVRGSNGLVTIGVFSLSSGAGSTYTSCELAERFAKAGFKVACVAYDGKSDFGYLGKSKVDYYFTEGENAGEKHRQLTAAISPGTDYNIVVIDFGRIIPVDSEGRLKLGNLADTENDRNELFRCNVKVGLCFNSPWDINKLVYFNNENIYHYNTIFGMSPFTDETADLFQNLQIAERDTDVLYLCLNEYLGLNTQKTKKKGLLR